MKAIKDLLIEMHEHGIELNAVDNQLRVSAPKGSVTPRLKALLIEHKQDILEFLIKIQAGGDAGLNQSIPIQPRDRTFPLSFGQQRLWFLDRLEGPNDTYNMPMAVRLENKLDRAVLDRVLETILARHEILRTTFPDKDGEPVQLIKPNTAHPPVFIDLSDTGAERDSRLEECIVDEARKPFDLASGPLFRTTLIHLDSQTHVLLLTMHHTISDGWSMGVLLREFVALYQAFCEGRANPLKPLPVQYVDYTVWQQEFLDKARLETQLTYWKNHLAGAPPLIELPKDRPYPAVQSHYGDAYRFSLKPAVAAAVESMAKTAGETPFVILLSAFGVLLSRYSRQNDIVIGIPIANRGLPELEPMIGFFANTLALRLDLTGEPDFRRLLVRVSEANLGAQSHQDIPFERLVDQLAPDRDLRHSPIFQVMVSMQVSPQFSTATAGLKASLLDRRRVPARFDMTLYLHKEEDHYKCTLEYNTDLFETETAVRISSHYQVLLDNLLRHPDQSVFKVKMLSESQRSRLLTQWNQTGVDYDTPPVLHQIITQQALKTPEAVALEFEDQALTYAQLEARTNSLAHHLRTLGVRRDTLVGVYAERSVEMVSALLAVIKAGGAYVPLDPSNPEDRLTYMIQDSQTDLLLTQTHLLSDLPQFKGERVILDGKTLDAALADLPQSNPCVEMDSLAAAYMIYTSGSTGRPKGVINNHRAIINRILWMHHQYGLDHTDRVLQKTPFSFDVSVWEFFWPLTAGARLVVAKPGGHQDPGYLADLIKERTVTTLHFVPSMMRAFLTEDHLERCSSIRKVFSSGEALPGDLMIEFYEKLISHAPGIALHNLYGPTEAAVDVTHWHCDPAYPKATLPIGKPVANTAMYVLDPHLQPTPVGVPGELHIGGIQLARGYHQRPDLTADRFIPNPFGNQGDRLYKTGDLAFLLPDGHIEYAGRIDFQVKLRGFRIELGEIENVLADHEQVKHLTVVVREDRPGDQRLVAYLQAVDAETEGAREELTNQLTTWLHHRLPEYMVPNHIIIMDALPLSPNGKIDRRALPGVGASKATEKKVEPPANELERVVAEIWAEVLGLESVGVTQTFFELGGHSLLMVKVNKKVKQRLGRGISMVDMFRHPTVKGFAGYLSRTDEAEETTKPKRKRSGKQIGHMAVVGMGGRFPDAANPSIFWDNLCNARESVYVFSDAELAESGVPEDMLADSNYVKAAVVLEGVDLFDAGFFGFSAREAEMLDPQQRLFLECCHQALEDAAVDPNRFDGDIGVFGGVGMNRYVINHLTDNAGAVSVDPFQLMVSNDKDFLASRAAYKLNLTGPAVTVQTACSTSMVAVQMAVDSIQSGHCDMAIAGGSAIRLPQRSGYLFREGMIMSPDGHCRVFDADAKGTILGSGAGAVVLKPLDTAVADGNHIYGVIRGLAVNNDGSNKISYHAPGIQGQETVIANALEAAKVDPSTISYVEAHGTGTELGDPIEIDALTRVYRRHTDRMGYCAIGSVKSNIGHLDAAAGVTALIKTLLALSHKQLPASLHYKAPNPNIDFAQSPFHVNTELTDWQTDGDYPRRAGLSSFGIGGTNVHAILEEAPLRIPGDPAVCSQLIPLSARSETALDMLAANLGNHLGKGSSIADAAYTMQLGRSFYPVRRAVVCGPGSDSLSQALSKSAGECHGIADHDDRTVIFMFSGQGSQYPNMGAQLYQSEAVFKEAVDYCCDRLQIRLGYNPRRELFPEENRRRESADRLRQTDLTQPMLFVVEYALAKLLMSWGIRPRAMIGHSIGEYVAACLAGVFSLDDALDLVETRARLMARLPEGAMLAVGLPADEVSSFLNGQVSLAVINEAKRCVIAGPEEAVAQVETDLAGKGVVTTRLHTSHAFHSSMMDPVLEDFKDAASRINYQPPKIPYMSNVSGDWISENQACDPNYWVSHLRRTVRFADGAGVLLDDGNDVFLEVGPGSTLASFLNRHPKKSRERVVLATLPRAKEAGQDRDFFLRTLGRLWAHGVSVDWKALHSGSRRVFLSLPTYPFERQSYWLGNINAGQPGRTQVPTAPQKQYHKRPTLETTYQAPRNVVEETLANIWREFLGIDEVGIRDNFMELGGDSLTATQVGGQIKKQLSVELHMDQLFAEPTIAGLAGLIATLDPSLLKTANTAVVESGEGRNTSAHEMTVGEILAGFVQHGLKVGMEDGALVVSGDTLGLDPALTEALTLREAEIVSFLAAGAQRRSTEQQITAQPRDGRHFPLSASQQRLWFLDQIEDNLTAFNIPWAMKVTGKLDQAAFSRAIDAIVVRHETLRTNFSEQDGRAVQIVHQNGPRLQFEDFSSIAEPQRSQRLNGRIQEETQRVFDLRSQSLFHVSLVALAPEEHALIFNIHHIIADGWSVRLFVEELAKLYTAFCNGEANPLQPLSVQYADFCVWEEQALQQRLAVQVDYWKQKLAGLPTLDFPTDRRRPLSATHEGDIVHFELSATLSQGILELSRMYKSSPFMTLLSAFGVMLQRYSGQEDFAIGIPIAGRHHSETQPLIGFFVNTLVLRLDLEGDLSFEDLLGRIRETTFEAYRNQDISFAKLVEEVNPERDLGRHPLFQIFFNMLNLPSSDMELGDIRLEQLTTPDLGAKFDMTLYVHEGEQFSFDCHYNTDLFDRNRIEVFTAQYCKLLELIVTGPAQPIQSYSLLESGRGQRLPDPSAPLHCPPVISISEQLKRAAMAHETRVAISHAGETWTYGELADAAMQISVALRARGLRDNDVVSVEGEACFGFMAGVVAVFWSGGVLLNLDPNLPASRRDLMESEAKARFRLQIGPAAENREDALIILPVSSDAGRVEGDFPPSAPNPHVPDPDGPAYVFFTSGTTGKPKGVLGRQKGLAHFASWQRTTFDVGPGDRCAQLTALSFDVVMRDIMLPLTSGATLCIPNREDLLDPARILPWLQENCVTHMHAVPSLVKIWINNAPQGVALDQLKIFFSAGEPLYANLVSRWRETFPGAGEIVNLYGPTETTLAKCFYTIPAQTSPGIQPVGRTMPDTQALVFAGDRQCSIGEPGEVVIRTPFRSLGYLESGVGGQFRVNPATNDPQDLLYHTGDLGRYRHDGLLEILGRIDFQVKIRGIRIEPGEIEGVLLKHDDVAESAVVAVLDESGDKRLAAYIIPGEKQPTESALRRYLQERLPEVMIPAAMMFLDAFPLLPNGKLNRRALPQPQSWGVVSQNAYVAPRTPSEEILAAIWGEVLRVPKVGVDSSFFELGGHSLMATQVITRISREFGLDLPVRALFSYPTVSGLAAVIDSESRKARGRELPALTAAENHDRPPLSFGQQRLWFLSQLEDQGAAYNVFTGLRMRGDLDKSALQRAVDSILERHQILRTTFAVSDDQPYQIIHQAQGADLAMVDLTDLPQDQREERAKHLVAQDSQLGFDLAAGPLIRFTLLRLAPDDHLMQWTLHHIVCDGWSIGVLIRELAALYKGYCLGETQPLEPLPIQYADYCIWQRRTLSGEEIAAQREYWGTQLGDAPALHQVPTDRPRPSMQTFNGALHGFHIPSQLRDQLTSLCRSAGVTLFMALESVFAALLGRYSGQDDIVIGSPIANRTQRETEPLIGLFVNTLAMRHNLAGDVSFLELLDRTRAVALDAYAHQDLPFEQMVEVVQPERNLSHSPIFQIMFILHNTPPAAAISLPGLEIAILEKQEAAAKFDMTLQLVESEKGIWCSWEYSTDLFDRTTIERMSGHFLALLERVLAAPETPVATQPLLDRDERHRVLHEWNQTQAEFPRDRCLHELFEDGVARFPRAPALFVGPHDSDAGWMSYAELNVSANKLAHHLRAQGAGPEALVGIYCERGPQMLIGLLGILKSGAAYVPLDPGFPADRLSYMMTQSGMNLLVAQDHLRNDLPGRDVTAVFLNEDGSVNGADCLPDHNPQTVAVPANSAYVIYTSGSTGKPKGVQLIHQTVVNFLSTMARQPGMQSDDIMAAVTTISFDIAVLELYMPLLMGARVVVVDRETAGDGFRLVQLLDQCGVTIMQATPATWRLLLNADWPGRANMKILCGGEALPGDLAAALLQKGSGLWNMYGPTETTVWSATREIVDHQGLMSQSAASIGRPVGNNTMFILDPGLEPAPVGVPGELLIGGLSLARGYLGRGDLTAERFIPNPFCHELDQPGARVYRTGDLVRYRHDGSIEFMGRLDHQVKVRGYRIELGEIETVLLNQDRVGEAVVIVREDRPGDKRITAYLVAVEGLELDVDAVRNAARRDLTDYMVPAAFMVLDALPLTPNRKIDRRALPAPERNADTEAAFVAPRTPTEEMLADIWGDILGHGQIGAHDHFFELGGHSLLATRTLSRIRKTFDVALPLRVLFEAPTIERLAVCIDQARSTQESGTYAAIPIADKTTDLPLSFAQQRLWFLYQLEGASSVYNLTIPLRLRGSLDVDAIQAAFDKLVARHDTLRTRFADVRGQGVQIIDPIGPFPLTKHDLRELDDTTRETRLAALVNRQAGKSFDLTKAPLLRADLYSLGERDHGLVMVMHHIISDGWSLNLLVHDLVALYKAQSADSAPLAELSIQYADYSVWQRKQLTPKALQKRLDFWKQRMAGAPTLLELPADRTRPPVQSFKGGRVYFRIDQELSTGLNQLAARHNVTAFMVLLSAFNAQLARYSGQNDIVIGSPVANRNRAEVEGLIGFFVNTVLLRNDLSADPSFLDLLLQVKETALEAFESQDLPFEQVVEALQPQRNLSYSPLFQVMFVLQNTRLGEIQTPDLNIAAIPIENNAAMYDLNMSIEETAAGLFGLIEYNGDIFDKTTVQRISEHYVNLLAAAAVNPEACISDLPMLGAEERERVLLTWNQTAADLEALPMHCIFEAQVAATPDAAAVLNQERSVTYAQLDRDANRIGRYLASLGVGPDMLLGVCMPRSIEVVTALLGIFKAGAAYMPIDPGLPVERIEFMLADAGSPVVLVSAQYKDLVKNSKATIVCLEDIQDQLAELPDSSPQNNTLPENLAYAIFTSGSTGMPKGVAVPHRGLANQLLWRKLTFPLTAEDRVLQTIPLSFDPSVWQIFWPLSVGAQVYMLTGEEHKDIARLAELIDEHRLTVTAMVPSMLRALLDEPRMKGNQHLKHISCGGEALSVELQQRFLDEMGLDKVLQVVYGPTEATIDATSQTCRRFDNPDTVHIGKAITNTQIYIVDPKFQPTPIGFPGELMIGGLGLARGYLNRPDLTAERFVPNPFGPAGSRLYRSGDLSRYLPTGNLEFLGRLDHQVKLRGFRIELGEIENALQQNPAVDEAVVMIREDQPGNKQLAAYLIPKGAAYDGSCQIQEGFDPAPLRDYLSEKLPPHMTPAVFLAMEDFPRNNSGKVNRRALPAPDLNLLMSAREFVAPRNPAEIQMAELWAELLTLEQVGVTDSFFEMGGHSLLVTKLVFNIKEHFGLDLPIRYFFENPTVADIVVALDALREGKDLDSLSGASSFRLIDEVVLPEEVLTAAPHWESTQPKAVFLTGATGFLGAFLLYELMHETEAVVYCLVRAKDPDAGLDRIRKTLEGYQLWDEKMARRIVSIPGNLADPLLGMSEAAFDELAFTLDFIIHNGALVNFVLPYQALKPANVGGTSEVLKLAVRHKVKPLTHISTYSVFVHEDYHGRKLLESDPLNSHPDADDGYGQTKWVAEKMVLEAQKLGLPTSVFRLGRVGGDTRNGAGSTADFPARVIKGCIQIGKAPAVGRRIEMTPVDFIARVVTRISLDSKRFGRNYHVVNPNTVTWRGFVEMITELGYDVDWAPYHQWRAALALHAETGENALTPLMSLFGEVAEDISLAVADQSLEEPADASGFGLFDIDWSETRTAIQDYGLEPPQLDLDYIRRVFGYYQRTGFIDKV